MPPTTGIPQGQREARISSHSHIKGLGLDDDGFAHADRSGFVGQRAAREVSPAFPPSPPSSPPHHLELHSGHHPLTLAPSARRHAASFSS